MEKFSEILSKIKFEFVNKLFSWIGNKIILEKKNSYDNTIIKFNPLLINSKDDINKEIFYDSIQNFLKVINEESGNFDLNIFIENFKRTSFNLRGIENDNNEELLSGWVELDPIIKYHLNTFDATNHEFFHMASRPYDFMICVNESYFTPYEEGYTQLLAERYFDEEQVYSCEVLIMKHIENILGKDYMEHEYSRGRLDKTINKLSKYESDDNIEKLFISFKKIFSLGNEMDIYDAKYQEEENKEKVIEEIKQKLAEIQNNMTIISRILLSCLKNKILNEEITLDNIPNRLEDSNIVYEYLPNEEDYTIYFTSEGMITLYNNLLNVENKKLRYNKRN